MAGEAGIVGSGPAIAGITCLIVTAPYVARQLPLTYLEHRRGLRLSAFVSSQLLVLGAVRGTAMSFGAGVIVALGGTPSPGLSSPPGWLVLVLSWTGMGLACMALAILLAAVSRSLLGAVAWSLAVTIAQTVLSGVVVPLRSAFSVLSWVFPGRWGVAAMAAWTDLNHNSSRRYDDAMWTHDASHVWIPLGVLALQVVVFAILATVALHLRWRGGYWRWGQMEDFSTG